jgi:hypothetical protein
MQVLPLAIRKYPQIKEILEAADSPKNEAENQFSQALCYQPRPTATHSPIHILAHRATCLERVIVASDAPQYACLNLCFTHETPWSLAHVLSACFSHQTQSH